MKEIALRANGLGKQYRIGQREQYKTIRESITNVPIGLFKHFIPVYCSRNDYQYFWALKDVSFEVEKGDVIGVIGRNGSGKSTLLKIISRITTPTEGRIELHGRVGSLLEVGTGFHPELTGRENIYLSGSILGMKKQEIEDKFDEIVKFSEIEMFLDTPVKRYSSGMYVRLAFAVAAHLEPEILLVDEVLAVGDANFQKKCLGKMNDVAKQGRTVMFVSHSMPAILNLCTKGILLDSGKIEAQGTIKDVVDSYLGENIGLNGEILFPKDRIGPKSDLKFTGMRVLDAKGHPTAYVDILEGFTLEIEYHLIASLAKAQVVFELWNSLGICVLCSTDFDESPESSGDIKRAGHYKASCFVPPAYLRPGRYWIDISSSIPGVQMLDEIRNALAFEVLNTGNIEFKLSQGRRGVIAPILSWKTCIANN
jgi:lipopolysaccharide transport system ATP-binding protein